MQQDLTSAAADLEHAVEILTDVGVSVSEETVPRARDWALPAWRGPATRRAWRHDRDQILLLQGRLEQYLDAQGIVKDEPSALGAHEDRWQRASNRRGRTATVTAAG